MDFHENPANSSQRANIGNANLTGFSDDLGLVNNQYGAAVSVVYATYVLFEPVWVLLLRIITPRILRESNDAFVFGEAGFNTFQLRSRRLPGPP